jgi:hypothetical protein
MNLGDSEERSSGIQRIAAAAKTGAFMWTQPFSVTHVSGTGTRLSLIRDEPIRFANGCTFQTICSCNVSMGSATVIDPEETFDGKLPSAKKADPLCGHCKNRAVSHAFS